MHGYTVGPFSIEATEAVAKDIILKFLVYLAKNISLRKYILKKTNLDCFLYFLRKDIGPAEDHMYGLSIHIHTEFRKNFIDRLSMSYVLYTKSGIDNT